MDERRILTACSATNSDRSRPNSRSDCARGTRVGLSTLERTGLRVLFLFGLVRAGMDLPYDASTWQVAVCSTALSAVVTVLVFWFGLRALRSPPEPRWAGALWAATPWHSVMLSALAYVGFYFIPIEVLAAAFILHRRAWLSGWVAPLLLASAARLASLAVVYALRELLR